MKKVAIVGAGPGGLASAKALAMEPTLFDIDLFERRDNIGGVWLYAGDKTKVLPSVPSTDPNGKEVLLPNGGFENRFMSSMYKYLETNLLDKLMEYSGMPFQPRSMNFIDRSDVLKYLQDYSKTIPDTVNVNLQTDVVDVNKSQSSEVWTITTKNVKTGKATNRQYDAVVVANGHSELPYVPDTPGLQEWLKTYPGSVTHSKYFVSSPDYKNETVLIIGNYASGMDLATQISTTAKKVYVSSKDDTLKESPYDYIQYLRLVTRYNAPERTVYTVDGKKYAGIDKIVFCTGYLYTFPFLKSYDAGITNGTNVKNLYKQIFNVADPSLTFVGLPKFISPLPLCECQAAVIARVFSGRIQLPEKEERIKSYLEELDSKGGGKDFHSLKDCDFTYCNELYNWIKASGSDGEGLVPLFWDEKRIEERQSVVHAKQKRTEEIVIYANSLRSKGLEFKFPPKA